ncbi:MAG: class I SAM-dependent methyltransferase [Candidatus Thorarchaeota archaeon]
MHSALYVAENIEGRLCESPAVPLLYVIREIMGSACEVYLEIGVLFGGSMAVVMQHKSPARFIGIDFFQGYYGMNKRDPKTLILPTRGVAERNIRKFNKYEHPYLLIKGDSTKDADRIVSEVDTNVDMLFIDGDHSFNGVKADTENYGPMMHEGGVIVYDNRLHRGVKQYLGMADVHPVIRNWTFVGEHDLFSIFQNK